ncbi:MAG: hypothetical protein M1826_000151 [Phylliscum demangeonii]|nr:MAG: hypothetical protein M1826_000151 [Phylliscum demangeonii]
MPSAPEPTRSPSSEAKPTSSYDSLMRLAILDDCVQDLVLAQEQLTTRISDLLSRSNTTLKIGQQLSEAKESLASVNRYVAMERKQVRLRAQLHADAVQSLNARRQAISDGRECQLKAEAEVDEACVMLHQSRQMLQQCKADIKSQQKRVANDLASIYPIESIPKQPLNFDICGIPLLNSSFPEDADDSTAAALGYVAHVVHLLSCYLAVPLPYPVMPQLSTSTIQDNISILQGSRIFPLYAKNSIQYRFEYGVFLLNKDIECLMNWQGAKVLDLRNTLPNLKYLLYTLTDGHETSPSKEMGSVEESTG